MNVTETIKEKMPRAMKKSMLYEDGEVIMRAWTSDRVDLLRSRESSSMRFLRIIEIGTNWGVSARILSDYGAVDTLDLVADSTANRVDAVLETPPGAVKRHSAPDQEGIDKLLRALVRDDGPFDIGHIDGDHSYDAVAHDFALLVEAGCKAVLIHDYGKLPPEGRGQAGVNDFVRGLPEGCWEDIEPFAAVDVVKLRETESGAIEAAALEAEDEGSDTEDTGEDDGDD